MESGNFVEPKPKRIRRKKKHAGGRPLTYNAWLHPIIARNCGRNGMNATQIAAEIGITRVTLYAWAKKFPEFSSALQTTKDGTDGSVIDSMLKRALGYDVMVDEVTVDAEGNKTIKRIKKHIPADPACMIFWAKNRRPAEWRDKREIENNGTVIIKHAPVELNNDELNTLRAIRSRLLSQNAN